jgi:hypothetical protein
MMMLRSNVGPAWLQGLRYEVQGLKEKPRPCGRETGASISAGYRGLRLSPRDSKRPPRKILLARKVLPGCNLESTTPAQKKTAPER